MATAKTYGKGRNRVTAGEFEAIKARAARKHCVLVYDADADEFRFLRAHVPGLFGIVPGSVVARAKRLATLAQYC